MPAPLIPRGESGSPFARPGTAIQDFTGLMRGRIEAADDDRGLRRFRVRVFSIHPDGIPVDHLPWAELCVPAAGKLWGDFATFAKGDLVFVTFENGDHRLPVIVGSWLSQSLGVPDLPPELAQDYARGQGRWVRIDRAGNVMELSENPAEQWVRLVSGAAQVVATQSDNSVSLVGDITRRVSGSGQDEIRFWITNSEEVLINAEAADALGGPNGIASLLSNLETNISAGVDWNTPGAMGARVNIGGYVVRFLGIPYIGPNGGHRIAPETNVMGRHVRLGVEAGRTQRTVPLKETEQLDINGVVVTIRAGVSVTAPSAMPPKIDIECVGTEIRIRCTGGQVVIQSDTQILIDAPIINIG